MTGGSDFFFRATCVFNIKKILFIISLKIHHQLENHRKELFSPELHWEIFCCITSCHFISKTRLDHATSPESKLAERGAAISHCTDFVSFHLYSLLSDPEFDPGFVNGPSDLTKLDDREAGVQFVKGLGASRMAARLSSVGCRPCPSIL